MIDNPLIKIKNNLTTTLRWIVIITAVVFSAITISSVQKLIFADAETTIISCDKFNGSYDIAYIENGEKKSILVDEKTARELFNKAQDDEAKKIAIDKCGLGGEVAAEVPQTFVLDIKKPFNNEELVIKNWQLAHDPNPHEATHGINALSRQKYPNTKGTGLHVGFDGNNNPLLVWLFEPKGSISGLASYRNCIPNFFRSISRYSQYITGARERGWNNITYLFDEWSAYIMGGKARLEMLKQGKRTDLSGASLIMVNITEGPADFTIIGGSIAVYLKRADPEYFNSRQFRSVLKLLFELSVGLIRDAEKVGNLRDAGHTLSVLNSLRTSPDAAAIRAVLTEMYGSEWTKRVLGF